MVYSMSLYLKLEVTEQLFGEGREKNYGECKTDSSVRGKRQSGKETTVDLQFLTLFGYRSVSARLRNASTSFYSCISFDIH
jgi:hypothetical protein